MSCNSFQGGEQNIAVDEHMLVEFAKLPGLCRDVLRDALFHYAQARTEFMDAARQAYALSGEQDETAPMAELRKRIECAQGMLNAINALREVTQTGGPVKHANWCLIDKPDTGPVHCTCGGGVS